MLRWFVIILFLNFYQCVFSQVGSVRVQVYSGGNLDFVFNSISDYKTGITYTNFTLIGIEVTEPLVGDTYETWELEVSADDADADGFLTGTDPANTLPFSSIEVQATLAAGCPSCNFFGSPFVPLAPDLGIGLNTVLVDGNLLGGVDDIPPNLAIATDQINISFRCGVTTSLLGETADYYSDDIFLDIIMCCGP